MATAWSEVAAWAKRRAVLAVDAQFAGDRAQAQAADGQRLDDGMLVAHPRGQPGVREDGCGSGVRGWPGGPGQLRRSA
jgi:hypothetical protein